MGTTHGPRNDIICDLETTTKKSALSYTVLTSNLQGLSLEKRVWKFQFVTKAKCDLKTFKKAVSPPCLLLYKRLPSAAASPEAFIRYVVELFSDLGHSVTPNSLVP